MRTRDIERKRTYHLGGMNKGLYGCHGHRRTVAQPAQGTWQSDREKTRKIGEFSSSKTTALQVLVLFSFIYR